MKEGVYGLFKLLNISYKFRMNLKEQMKIPKKVSRKYKYESIRFNTGNRRKKEKKRSLILEKIIEYIKNNIKEYIIITLIFLIGIFLGVMFVNNLADEQKTEIITYVKTYVEAFKQTNSSDNIILLQNNIRDNIILTLIIWFIGSTIIGIPIVFGIIMFRGFCLGYAISSITVVFGVAKGIAFTAIAIIMQNILYIPAIISLGVSALKAYKSIYSDKRKENIKLEIIRHTVFSALVLIILIASAVVETQISTNLLRSLIKYF